MNNAFSMKLLDLKYKSALKTVESIMLIMVLLIIDNKYIIIIKTNKI
jgi:hypothetical protein